MLGLGAAWQRPIWHGGSQAIWPKLACQHQGHTAQWAIYGLLAQGLHNLMVPDPACRLQLHAKSGPVHQLWSQYSSCKPTLFGVRGGGVGGRKETVVTALIVVAPTASQQFILPPLYHHHHKYPDPLGVLFLAYNVHLTVPQMVWGKRQRLYTRKCSNNELILRKRLSTLFISQQRARISSPMKAGVGYQKLLLGIRDLFRCLKMPDDYFKKKNNLS